MAAAAAAVVPVPCPCVPLVPRVNLILIAAVGGSCDSDRDCNGSSCHRSCNRYERGLAEHLESCWLRAVRRGREQAVAQARAGGIRGLASGMSSHQHARPGPSSDRARPGPGPADGLGRTPPATRMAIRVSTDPSQHCYAERTQRCLGVHTILLYSWAVPASPEHMSRRTTHVLQFSLGHASLRPLGDFQSVANLQASA